MTITTTIKEFPISNMWNDAELMNIMYRSSRVKHKESPTKDAEAKAPAKQKARRFAILDRQLQTTGAVMSARTPSEAANKVAMSSKKLSVVLQDVRSLKRYKYKRARRNDRFVPDKE